MDIRLLWSANTEKDLAGYKIYYGTKSGVYDKIIKIGKKTEHIIKGLENKTYFFTVTAYNEGGFESEYCTEKSTKAPKPVKGLKLQLIIEFTDG